MMYRHYQNARVHNAICKWYRYAHSLSFPLCLLFTMIPLRTPRAILQLTKRTLLIAPIIRMNRHCVAPKCSEIARASDAPVRIVGILPRGNYRRSTNGPSPYRVRSLRRSRAVLRERVVFLRDASVPMNRANLTGRKIKSITSLSRSAHFCELLAIRGTFVRH